MTLRHLKIFLCVAKHENITHAAEELYMAQPAVSLAISQLEEYYNIKLFDRVKQRIKITENGKLLLQYANSIINDFDDFEEIAFNKSKNQNIKLGVSLSVGDMLVPNLFKNYIDKSNLSFLISTSNSIIDSVLSSNLEMGIVETPNIDNRLIIENLGQDELILVASNEYEIPSEITINELIKYPLLLRNNNTGVRNTFDNALKSQNIIVKPVIESISNSSLIEFAKMGYGVAVLPSIVFDGKDNLKIIKLIDIKLIRPISLIYKYNKKFNENEKKLISYIKTNISTMMKRY